MINFSHNGVRAIRGQYWDQCIGYFNSSSVKTSIDGLCKVLNRTFLVCCWIQPWCNKESMSMMTTQCAPQNARNTQYGLEDGLRSWQSWTVTVLSSVGHIRWSSSTAFLCYINIESNNKQKKSSLAPTYEVKPWTHLQNTLITFPRSSSKQFLSLRTAFHEGSSGNFPPGHDDPCVIVSHEYRTYLGWFPYIAQKKKQGPRVSGRQEATCYYNESCGRSVNEICADYIHTFMRKHFL